MNVGNITRAVATVAASGVLTAASQRNDLSEDAVRKERPLIEREISKAITDAAKTEGIAVVGVKPASQSKINNTQIAGAVGIIATLAAGYGFEMDAQTQVAIVAAIGLGIQVVTWFMRTYFTKSVTASSLG